MLREEAFGNNFQIYKHSLKSSPAILAARDRSRDFIGEVVSGRFLGIAVRSAKPRNERIEMEFRHCSSRRLACSLRTF